MKFLKRHMFVSMLIATFISLLLTAGVASATSQRGGSRSIVSNSTNSTGTINSNPNDITNGTMNGIAVVSANNIWAVGFSLTGNTIQKTLIEHWNGTSWSVVSSPNVGTGNNYLASVVVISANNIWAVGAYTANTGFLQTLIERWNGSNWSVVSSPNAGIGDHLTGVAAVSQNNVWAVGFYYNGSVFQTLIEQWNGSSWSVISSPNVGTGGNFLEGVAAASQSNVWAVGFSINSNFIPQTLTERWNGSSWSVVSSPNAGTGGDNLYGVAVVSKNDIWSVGTYSNSNSVFQTLIEHWNGSSWSVATSPNVGTRGNTLNGVAAVSKSNVWAVGSYIDSNGFGRTLIEHWNGTKWKVVSSPNVGTSNNQLLGVATVSASDAWAVGSYLNSNSVFRTLIEQWNGSSWSVVTSPT